MVVEKSAPSNIALIKYMGKSNSLNNSPTNSSLSYTLEHLRSFVRLTLKPEFKQDQWNLLEGKGLEKTSMSQKSIDRYLKHFSLLKTELGIQGAFLVESANNFPADCGLASSASSFAALTLASAEVARQMNPQREHGVENLAELSRRGSGSSCRSFFAPWGLWFSEGVRPLELGINQLKHQVVVVDQHVKEVSSSEAHLRVLTSPLFEKRAQRAEARMAELLQVLRNPDWKRAFEICWSEFWDMHALFETSQTPFGYMTAGSLKALEFIRNYWKQHQDGPLVTMDAGPNVHLLYRQDQAKMALEIQKSLVSDFRLIGGSEFSEDPA